MNILTRFAVLLFLSGIGPVLFAQTLPMTSLPTANPGEVKFTVPSVPILPGAHPSRLYRVFWDFGDGTYETETYTLAEMTGLGDLLEKTHIYDDTDPHNVRAELTQIYSPPNEKNLRYSAPTGPVSAVTPGFPTIPLKDLYGQSIRVDRTRNLRRGFATNFLLTYEVASNPVCNVARNGGTVEITYGLGMEPDLALLDETIWDETEGYHGETISIDPVLRIIEVGVASDIAAANDQRELIINFFSPEDTDVLASFFTARLKDSLGNDCGKVSDEKLVFRGKKDPYDPNFKAVAEDTITLNESQWLNYILQCQNIGAGPTDSITIVDVLDARLDPSTITVEAVRMGFEEILAPAAAGDVSVPAVGVPAAPFSFNYKMEQSGATVIWTLYNIGQLRGLMEPMAGLDFVERETIAQIEFRVKTYCFEEELAQIPNAAEVYFDALAPVHTDTAFTDKFCCQQRVNRPNGTLDFDLLKYAAGSLMAPFDTANMKIVSLTSDSLAGMAGQPMTFLLNGRLEYLPAPMGYRGIDIVTFTVCDLMGTCDTFQVAICVDVDPSRYICDTTNCISVRLETEISQRSYLHIYPNPFEDILVLDNELFNKPIQQVTIYNLYGQECYAHAFERHAGPVSLHLSHLPAGMYLLWVDGEKAGKVMKK